MQHMQHSHLHHDSTLKKATRLTLRQQLVSSQLSALLNKVSKQSFSTVDDISIMDVATL
jgi:hypothetical protein